MLKDILIIGGGKIGSVVADLLADTPEHDGYRVTLADRSAELLAEIARDTRKSPRIDTLVLDANDGAALRASASKRFCSSAGLAASAAKETNPRRPPSSLMLISSPVALDEEHFRRAGLTRH